MAELLLCQGCTHWRDVPAYPELGDRCGSLRVCERGETTHSGSWKPCWEPRTDEQRIRDANEVGRLF